jgi:hypothetical protein
MHLLGVNPLTRRHAFHQHALADDQPSTHQDVSHSLGIAVGVFELSGLGSDPRNFLK